MLARQYVSRERKKGSEIRNLGEVAAGSKSRGSPAVMSHVNLPKGQVGPCGLPWRNLGRTGEKMGQPVDLYEFGTRDDWLGLFSCNVKA